jgi:hypothetical protein
LLLAFWRGPEVRDGTGSRELEQYRFQPVGTFALRCLKLVLRDMFEAAWERMVVNRQLSRIKAVFSWGVSNGLSPGEVAHRCREVRGLRPGE